MKYGLIYDGKSVEEKYTDYYFTTEGLENAQDLFYDLYEEDIEDYAYERLWGDEGEYEINATIICLSVSNKTGKVKYKTIAPEIKLKDGRLRGLEDADIVLKKKFVDELMSLVPEKDRINNEN